MKWLLPILFALVIMSSYLVAEPSGDAGKPESIFKDKGNNFKFDLPKNSAAEGNSTVEFSKAEPKVIMEKWDGEAALTVSYSDIVSPATLSGTLDKVEWKSAAQELHAYPLSAKEGMENGGTEIEIILKSKPAKNVFDFTVEGAEEMDFFYQGALTEQPLPPAAVSCTDTNCFNGTGETVAYRPENVIGSYAVYSKTKKNHIVGQTNYATGKIMHIYRPHIIDAIGNTTWGELNYANGVLSVTVPQKFLDDATYPVIVDPTFGYGSIGGTSGTITASYVMAVGPYSPASDGNATSVSMYTSGTTDNGTMGIYADGGANGPTSQSLLKDSAGGTFGGLNWYTQNLDSSLAITTGTKYWAAFIANGNLPYRWDDGTPTYFLYYYNTGSYSAGAMPNPFSSSPSSVAQRASIYATYTIFGSGWLNLGLTDPANWAATNSINQVAYGDGNVYTVGTNGSFGVYNVDTNVWTDLRTADTGNWMSTAEIRSVTYDSTNDVVWVGSTDGRFGKYSPDTGILQNFSTNDTGNWASSNGINDIQYDSTNNTIYTALDNGTFGRYNYDSNIWQNFSTNDTGNWVAASAVNGLAFDSTNELIWTVAAGGKLGAFSPDSNIWENYSTNDTANWAGTTTMNKVAYDSNHDLVYVVGASGTLSEFNLDTNIWKTLATTDPTDWMGTSNVVSVAYNSGDNLIYTGAAVGKLGAYNIDANGWENLSATDAGDWASTNQVNGLSSDTINGTVYTAHLQTGANGNNLGVYNVGFAPPEEPPVEGDVCTPPASGNWVITGGVTCTVTTNTTLPSGVVVRDGRLYLKADLALGSGGRINIEKPVDANKLYQAIVVEKTKRIVINK